MFNLASFRRDFLEGNLIQIKDSLWKECSSLYRPIRAELREKNSDFLDIILDIREQIFNGYDEFIRKYNLYGKSQESMVNIYYSTIAHLRNNLHISKISGTKFLSAIGTNPYNWWTDPVRQSHIIDKKRLIYKWTMEDQERLVRKYIDLYTIIK